MLYPGSRFRMADELLETYLRQLIEAHGQIAEVTIAWQGGEPTLMGLGFFRRSVELAQRYLRPGQRAAYTIQTNGTLLDDRWASFFLEHDFLVGISIDGPREIHDAYRVNKGGRGSFDQVMRGLGFLREAGVQWNALVTVHAANGDRGRAVQMFDVALANWVGEPPGLCIHSETCGLALALEHTGDLYSCDHFVEPRYLLGNIAQHRMLDLVSSPRQQQFGLDKRDTLPRFCRECDARFACHGGCPKDRFTTTPDGDPGLNYLCPGFTSFFHHIDKPMRTMGELLRRNRPPAQIMALCAAQDAQRGRNDPCTCGSGHKWKRCHGAPPGLFT
jgi:uncharacterized protein